MRRSSGAILLEILISLALFVTAGSIILVSTTSMTSALVRSRDRQIAFDLAVAKMAELEAGLTTAEQLHDSLIDVSLLSEAGREGVDAAGSGRERWRVVVETEPSRFTPLTNVTIRIFEARGRRGGEDAPFAVIHQLLRLNSAGPEEFETDPILDAVGAAETAREAG